MVLGLGIGLVTNKQGVSAKMKFFQGGATGLRAVSAQNISVAPLTRARRWVSLPLALTILATSSCVQTTQLANHFGVGSIASNDRCGKYSQSLREAKGYFERSMIQGAALGAIGGAVLGGLLGGNKKAFLVGSLAGAAIGASSGYWAAKQQQTQDKEQLSGTVYKDLSAERAEILRALASFSEARDCRLSEAKIIKADFAAGRLDRNTTTSSLEQERKRFADDIVVVRAIGAKIDERHKELIVAVDSIASNTPEARELLQKSKEAEQQDYKYTSWTPPTDASQNGQSTSGTFVTALANVNVRAEPKVSSPQVQLFMAGENAKSLSMPQNGWTKIALNSGMVGYVSSQYVKDTSSTTQVASGNTLASLTRSVPSSADTEIKIVGVMFEGREKRLELERLTLQAEKEENTVFSLEAI